MSGQPVRAGRVPRRPRTRRRTSRAVLARAPASPTHRAERCRSTSRQRPGGARIRATATAPTAQTGDDARTLTRTAPLTATWTNVPVDGAPVPSARARHAAQNENAVATSSPWGLTVPPRNRHIGVIAAAIAQVAEEQRRPPDEEVVQRGVLTGEG